ncbi:MAG: pseudouridine synthase, partial [Candidatus Komeilibacteria bacterium]|nr:pseudouridine synthase [Candidatus Komeilibacteria bacterium]
MRIVLQKALADAGVASRRAAEEMIMAGRVWVNGARVNKLGTRVNPATDKITVDKKPISTKPELVYFLLNKPLGVVATVHDTHNRPAAVELIPTKARIVPVGRLDINTTGLLLLTNDGDLVYRLTHPKFEHPKEYEVLIQIPHTWEQDSLKRASKKLAHPMRLTDGVVSSPAEVKVLEQRSNDRYLISLTIHEGRKHQVRQMINSIGASVVELKRVRMGPIVLGNLAVGKYRSLTEEEI